MSDTDTIKPGPFLSRREADILLAAEEVLGELTGTRALSTDDREAGFYVAGQAAVARDALNLVLISANVRLKLGYANPNAPRRGSL